MAKPIKMTPRLKGENALRFAERMDYVERSRISSIDKKLSEEISREKVYFVVA